MEDRSIAEALINIMVGILILTISLEILETLLELMSLAWLLKKLKLIKLVGMMQKLMEIVRNTIRNSDIIKICQNTK